MTRSNTFALFCALLTAAALLWPTDAQAQRRRAVRFGGGRSVVVVGTGFFSRPFFYDPWYGWGYPYGWYPPPYAYGRYGDSSLRLQVEPRETEVFIDGYYAGTVDDFDGFFQRLRLEPGEHEIQLYLAGHRTMRQKVYLQPTGTFRIRHTMQPLGPGETADPRPDPPPNPRSQSGGYGPPGTGNRVDPRDPPERPARDSEYGALAIRVQPEQAEVLIDGERWDGPGGSDRLIIQLAEGEHRIEVRREGFSTYSSTVHVRRGETTALNISLVRE